MNEAPRPGPVIVGESGRLVAGPTEALLVLGGSTADRRRLADALAERRAHDVPGTVVWRDERPATWPFRPDLPQTLPPADSLVVVLPELHAAFPDHQINGTRLVLTQSLYLLQTWLDELDRRPRVLLVATADTRALEEGAPEALDARGPWARFDVTQLAAPAAPTGPDAARETNRSPHTVDERLGAAFGTASPGERLAACQAVREAAPTSTLALLALASACMEHLALDEAQRALDRAISSAPDWAAAHYEQGKLHLRRENMEAACASFAEATRLMPGFSPAFSNLGATLGELDRPEEALDALERARALDPFGVQVINNIGVVTRELGRLAESEAALRDVVALSPDFVFGHYNLGHTLFLAGRFDAAVDAYREGQRRDPTRNPVQASRLAFARLAAGDPTSALDELGGALGRVDPDRRAQLVADSQEMAAALRGWRHDLPGLDAVDRLLANG